MPCCPSSRKCRVLIELITRHHQARNLRTTRAFICFSLIGWCGQSQHFPSAPHLATRFTLRVACRTADLAVRHLRSVLRLSAHPREAQPSSTGQGSDPFGM